MIQIPGYLIKREIGIGGMAKVYLAVQTSLEREVALKVMNPAMVSDPSFSRRFTQEARTLASLAHPNIVAVYDVGITEEKLHYFSMQHLPNGDFLKRIRNGVPEAEVVRVLSGVARALGFAHQRGIVHRDVAPGNVLFDPNDNPVLTDFGIARAVTKTSRITNAGVSVGTSHYMSPEQARGSDVDGRSDVYSLGALAFEALTGNPPYDGEDGFAIAYAHVFEPVPTLPEHRRHWQPLIDRAMAKDPAERFQGTEEFLAALTRITALAEPTHASKPARAPDAPTVPMPALPKLFASAAAMASNLVNRKPNAAPEADADAPAPAARVPAATGPTHPDTAQPKPPVAPPRPVRAESVPTADAPTRPAPLPVLTTAESGPAGESATLRTAAAAAHSPSAPAAPSTGSARPMPPTPVIAATEKPPSTTALHDQVTPIVNRIPVTESETPSVNYTPHRTAPDNAATAQATTRSAPLPAPTARHDAPTPTPPSRRREPPVDPARTRAAPSGTPRPRWLMPAAIAALVAALVIGALVWSGKSDSPGTLPAVATDPGTTQSSSSAPDPLAADGTDPLESTGTDQTGLNLDDSAWLVPADPSLQSEADRAYYQVAVATTVIDPVATLLRLARADLAAQRLTQPPGRNAGERYALALKIEPKNAEAKAGLLETGRAYAKMAATALAAGQLAEWQDYSERAIAVAGEFDSAGELRQNYQDQRNQLLNAALDEGRSALARWDEAAATSAFQRALALTPGQAEASAGIKSARGIGKPGYVFSDVIGKGKGPELIIKQIAGKRLAVARTEVTVDQFRQFWAAGGATSRAQRPSCRDRESGFRSSRSRTWQSPGFAQTGAHPVVCVDWEDAQAYAAWLGKASGQRYRLASAAEWEALASQGGKLEDCGANIGDRQFNARYRDRSALACDDGAAETAAVRRFAATGGVFDLVGNVREWVSDCAGNCRKHLAMGSSWASVAGELEVAQREDFDADTGYNTVGLRVVREID